MITDKKTSIYDKMISIIEKTERIIILDSRVLKAYERAGKEFGDSLSYLDCMGRDVDFEVKFLIFQDWEKAYAKRGYKTVPIDDFLQAGGYGKDISHMLGVKRAEDELAILHCDKIRDEVLVELKD